MQNFIYDLLFVLISLYVLIKTIYYGIYEIKQNNNKTGGISVIAFSLATFIFTNLVLFIKGIN